jgi:drug/metabolite transporter (DMT)-like permease
LLFSTGGTAIKFAGIGGLPLAGLRSLVAAVAFFLFIRIRRRSGGEMSILKPGRVGIAVAIFYAATMIMFVVANKLTTAANAIFLQSTAPLYVLLAGPVLLGERASTRDLAYGAIVATGMILFCFGGDAASATAPEPARGNWIGAASALTWAGTIMGLRRLRIENRPVLPALFWGNASAFAVCLPWIAFMSPPGPADALIVIYLGAFQVAVAYVALSAGVGGVSALEASLLLLLEPVCSSLLAAFAHRELPGGWSLAGCSLILCATAGRSILESKAVR